MDKGGPCQLPHLSISGVSTIFLDIITLGNLMPYIRQGCGSSLFLLTFSRCCVDGQSKRVWSVMLHKQIKG